MTLEEQILRANALYREGHPVMSDKEYDSLLDALRESDPTNPILKKGIIDPTPRVKEKLPWPMFSLEKFKKLGPFKKWLKGFPEDVTLIVTPKYDGISILFNEQTGEAWTRGDGIEGLPVKDHMLYVHNGETSKCPGTTYSFGEMLCMKNCWEDLASKTEYTNPRNAVAGLFNRQQPDPILLNNLIYIRYGTSSEDLDKDKQIGEFLNSTEFIKIRVGDLLDRTPEWYNNLFTKWSESYNIDGLVFEINNTTLRNKLGRLSNDNPAWAMALKLDEWDDIYKSTVERITWEVSKDHKLKPVVEISPVEIQGSTIKRITGYNYRYVLENHLCPGSVITFIKSGKIIPKHIQTLSFSFDSYESLLYEMRCCPICGSQTEISGVELYCNNDSCPSFQTNIIYHFLTTLGIERVGTPIIKKIVANNIRLSDLFIDISIKNKLLGIGGLGEIFVNDFLTQINNLKRGVDINKLLVAFNVFNGVIGVKQCQEIYYNTRKGFLWELIQYPQNCTNNSFKEELIGIQGIGVEIASSYLNGIKQFTEIKDILIPYYFPEQKCDEDICGAVVCFSGFRDKVLEQKLQTAGYKVQDNFNKRVEILIVKDKSANTSKIIKAKELGIKIVEPNELEF